MSVVSFLAHHADVESNFSANGIVGRWAIRSITTCVGNTGVSLVTGKVG